MCCTCVRCSFSLATLSAFKRLRVSFQNPKGTRCSAGAASRSFILPVLLVFFLQSGFHFEGKKSCSSALPKKQQLKLGGLSRRRRPHLSRQIRSTMSAQQH